MIVPDVLIWFGIFFLAILFNLNAFDQPTEIPRENSTEREPLHYGEILSMFKGTMFFFFAWMCWLVLAYLSSELNNCSFSFSACFTSPSYLTTTTTIATSPWANYLYFLFQGLAWVNFIIGAVMLMYLILPADRIPEPFQRFARGRQ